jgi:ABC-type lipoprotein release transport system permease subunit
MILKIGWKNIWRKKGRSIIVILSVAFGIWIGMFFGAFQWGTYVQKLDDIVNREIGHVQVHDPSFMDEEYDYNFPIINHPDVKSILESDSLIKVYVERSIFSAMLQTTQNQKPVLVYGVDTAMERNLHSISSIITDGEMVSGRKAPTLLIGKKLADELNIKLGDKLLIQGGMLHGLKSFVGRVRGFYESPNKLKDKLVVYAHKTDLDTKLGDGFVHEYAVLFNDFDSLNAYANRLQAKLPNHQVNTWGEIMPEIENGIKMTDQVMFVFMLIIWIALSLGIVNTMLMSILERTRELGMLMAIGMSRWKIVRMIFFETSILTLIGVPIGIFLTIVTVGYFGDVGIDLSVANAALEDFGYSTMIYPKVKTSFYYQVIFQVILVSFISTIFPVIRALRLKPIEAIHKT